MGVDVLTWNENSSFSGRQTFSTQGGLEKRSVRAAPTLSRLSKGHLASEKIERPDHGGKHSLSTQRNSRLPKDPSQDKISPHARNYAVAFLRLLVAQPPTRHAKDPVASKVQAAGPIGVRGRCDGARRPTTTQGHDHQNGVVSANNPATVSWASSLLTQSVCRAGRLDVRGTTLTHLRTPPSAERQRRVVNSGRNNNFGEGVREVTGMLQYPTATSTSAVALGMHTRSVVRTTGRWAQLQ